ncbi:MAG: discoidin domain-containing protein, partial [Acidimicrobiia bacterium]|nr:discoidin domain-containing protein [Acidimicrobiia bacterium]
MPRRLATVVALVGVLTALLPVISGVPARATDGSLGVEAFVAGEAAVEPGPEVPVGDETLLTLEVSNTGSDTLYALYLWVDGVGAVTCPERRLRPGDTVVCETSIVAEAGEQRFGVEASAWPDGPGGEVATTTVVYRGVEVADDAYTNVALGRPARHASSQQWRIGTDAGLAVDGDRDGDIDAGSVAITYRVSEAWWEVDLGVPTDIDHVVLWNRTDCCSDRLERVHVFVSEDPFPARDIDGISSEPGVTDVFLDRTLGRKTVVPVGATGRYVRVQLDYLDAVLALAEVEVMAAAATAPAPPPPAPGIALSVTADGLPTAAPGPTLDPGAPVSFTYRVENTGPMTMWAPFVWHDGVGAATCPARRIDPGAAVECTAEGTVPPGAAAARATAQAWASDGTEAEASVTVNLVGGDGDQGPSLAMTVLAAGADTATAPGPAVSSGPLAYEYRVTNTGGTNLWALTIWHDGVGAPACDDRSLAPGDSTVCTATAPVPPGRSARDVTAWSWDDDGTRASAAATVHLSAPVAGVAELALVATVDDDDAEASPGPVVAAGDVPAFAFDVANTGTEVLYGLWISAGPYGAVSCPEQTIRPGETVTCTAGAPASPGTYGTSVRAVGYTGGGDEVDAIDRLHWFVPEAGGASIELEYLIDGLDGETPWGPRLREADVATFTFIVTNTGDRPLTDVAVSDERHGDIDCPRTELAPGATLVCSTDEVLRLQRTVTWATVTATSDLGEPVEDSERLYFHVKPFGREDELLLEVSVDGRDADEAPGP